MPRPRSISGLAILAAAAACAIAAERIDPARGYRIDLPDGWIASERAERGAHVLRLSAPDAEAWVEVHATPRAPTAPAVALERALIDFECGFLRDVGDIERVGKRPATLAGIEGLAAVYRANDEEPWSLGAFVGRTERWSYALAWASADHAGAALAELARRTAESFALAPDSEK